MEGVKFILLGDGNVGKTCLMLSFAGKSIRANHIKTIGIDMEKRIFNYEGNDIEVKIWDTAGQERYRNSLPKDLFHRLNGILLVYDVTRRKSFTSVNSWMNLIKENASANTAAILIGNKADNDMEITEAEGKSLADSYSIPFILTSAKNGLNVEQAFSTLLQITIEKDPNIILGRNDHGKKLEKLQKKKGACC